MNFGEAIDLMKNGYKITRECWKESFFTGRRQYIFIGRNTGMETKTFLPIPDINSEMFGDTIMCISKSGKYYPNWIPTQEDMLSEDWTIWCAKSEYDSNVKIKKMNTSGNESYELKAPNGWKIVFCSTAEEVIANKVSFRTVESIKPLAVYGVAFEITDDRRFEYFHGIRKVSVGKEELEVYCADNCKNLVAVKLIDENAKTNILGGGIA